MSIKHSFTLVCFIWLFSTYSYAQNKKRLIFDPEHPVAGQTLDLSYQPLHEMSNAKQVKALMYSFCNFKWETREFHLTEKEGCWKLTLKIPINAGLLAFKFCADSVVDNNDDRSFACMVYDKNGELMPGAYAGWGGLRSKKYGYEIPNYLNLDKAGISDSAVFHWIDMEVQNRKESSIPMASLYATVLKDAKIAGAESRIERIINFLLKDASEDALMQAIKIAYIKGNNVFADSISNLTLTKYPKGKLAFKNRYFLVNNEKDLDKKYTDLLQMIRDFPENDYYESYLNVFSQTYSNIYQTILMIDAVNKSYKNVFMYIPKMSLGTSIGTYYKLIEVPHNRKDKSDSELLPYAKFIVDHVEQISSKKPNDYALLSDEEWTVKVQEMMSKSLYVTYVDILKNTGNAEKALEYAHKAQKVLGYKSAQLNGDMALLLKQAGKMDELQHLLEKSLFFNQTSEVLMGMLKDIYYAEHNSSYSGYESYVEGLKDPASKSALTEEIKEYKKEGAMPTWRMLDASGKLISSEQLKGKVYVLDFWASWCVPCKASFPGMKMAIDHYKDDKDVSFFFIDTQEYGTNYEERAVKYLKDNNFPFNLLFDDRKTGNKANDVYANMLMSKYSLSGIPLKVVVDKKGNIQFISIGYKGSPSGLAEEIIEMVEQAKQAQ